MARSKPTTFVLDRSVFLSINTAVDAFVATSVESVKGIDTELKGFMQSIQASLQEMQNRYDAISAYKQSIDEEICAINTRFIYESNPVPIDTSGLEDELYEARRKQDDLCKNLSMLQDISNYIDKQYYKFEQTRKAFEEFLQDDLSVVKERMVTLDDIIGGYQAQQFKL